MPPLVTLRLITVMGSSEKINVFSCYNNDTSHQMGGEGKKGFRGGEKGQSHSAAVTETTDAGEKKKPLSAVLLVAMMVMAVL